MEDEKKQNVYEDKSIDAVCNLIRKRLAEDLMRAVTAGQSKLAKGNKDEIQDKREEELH